MPMARFSDDESEPGRVATRISLRAGLMKRRPTAGMASAMFPLFVVGMVLLIAAVPLTLASLFAVFGQIGSGWADRVIGAAGVGAGLGVFWIGKRLSDEFGPW